MDIGKFIKWRQGYKYAPETVEVFFNGDHSGPVRYHSGNVDLDRFRQEMAEIGYIFVVSY